MRTIELLTTGGTIEKTYDEFTGALDNRGSIVQRMLSRLKLPETVVHTREVFSKDSLHITDEERRRIVEAVRTVLGLSPAPDGVVILHGTDTLHVTGELLHAELAVGGRLTRAVVLTGAMRPFEMKRSDALQNLTESLLASTLLPGGVYAVAHGRALRFPGVVKDREKGTFMGGAMVGPG
ncbi:MAG: asparaginase domain-containing protein [Planctomycetota bacterium]|nr:asparaginase domain-containing protein [Planctomycetota bacterium]